ncbi:RNA polymerase subunit sigma [Pontibacillus chungwhensis BH030062]|uniref:RNA polymerase subunit sigma n=1 Tax=Pontibacillus chungwhensis BH030062 TaxID=1385513 RepID=A0A0A2V990_9BACI|nr:sigma-70 family RNA polymerase sigma factor [Pontibacillus chungwhensis]KGP90265.1 RNA polymerase subunit sigma [Pontibacillus chungwhensis BH030062]
MHGEREWNKQQSKQELLTDLMERHGDMVLRIAYTYAKDRARAEDLAQEVFIRCYHSLDSFEERSSYQTWLYRITVNYCKDYVRSWSFRNLIPKSVLPERTDELGSNVMKEVIQNEEKNVLFDQVLKLSIKYREVVILYYYEDLSVDEVASVLDCNSNTVKSRLRRARERLKHLVEGGMIVEE